MRATQFRFFLPRKMGLPHDAGDDGVGYQVSGYLPVRGLADEHCHAILPRVISGAFRATPHPCLSNGDATFCKPLPQGERGTRRLALAALVQRATFPSPLVGEVCSRKRRHRASLGEGSRGTREKMKLCGELLPWRL